MFDDNPSTKNNSTIKDASMSSLGRKKSSVKKQTKRK
jgi:hypothetical protein